MNDVCGQTLCTCITFQFSKQTQILYLVFVHYAFFFLIKNNHVEKHSVYLQTHIISGLKLNYLNKEHFYSLYKYKILHYNIRKSLQEMFNRVSLEF